MRDVLRHTQAASRLGTPAGGSLSTLPAEHSIAKRYIQCRIFYIKYISYIYIGSLKIDHTEGVLLDIRQASLTCEQQKGKMIQRINKIFQDLARTLKARKTELLTQIEESFENEREKIVENEEVWKKKQVICEELLRLNGTESGNKDILLNSKYIMEGIKEISTPITFQDMKLVHSLGDHLKVEADEEGDLTLEMLLKLLSEYVQPTEYKTLQYRS